MAFETFRFPPPLPPPGLQGPILSPRPAEPGGTGFDEALLSADPAEVEFALDRGSVRIQDEREAQWNTTWSATGEMFVSAPGVEAQAVPLRFEATMRNDMTVSLEEPATMADSRSVCRVSALDRVSRSSISALSRATLRRLASRIRSWRGDMTSSNSSATTSR